MNSKYQFINGRCCESLTWTSQRHDLSKFCSSGASAFSSRTRPPTTERLWPTWLESGWPPAIAEWMWWTLRLAPEEKNTSRCISLSECAHLTCRLHTSSGPRRIVHAASAIYRFEEDRAKVRWSLFTFISSRCSSGGLTSTVVFCVNLPLGVGVKRRGANWFSSKPVYSSKNYSGHVWARSIAEDADSFRKEYDTLCSKASWYGGTRSHGMLSRSSSKSCGGWLTLESVVGRTPEGRRFTGLVEELLREKCASNCWRGCCYRARGLGGPNQGFLGRHQDVEKERSVRESWFSISFTLAFHFGPTDVSYRHAEVTSAWRRMHEKWKTSRGSRNGCTSYQGSDCFATAERGSGAMPTVVVKCIRSHRPAESSDFSRTCCPGVVKKNRC